MSFSLKSNFEYDDFDVEKENEFHIQEEMLFLVDGTQDMFQHNFFRQCLETYTNIARQKCSHNKKDKLGLFIYGVNETNCDVDNLMVLQKFDTTTIDSLKNIKSILNNYSKYEELSLPSSSEYSLYEFFSYTFREIHAKTSARSRNIIVLCTCNDNPCNNSAEEDRIKHLVSTFKDTRTELRVIGFSSSWNDEVYFKDLQILSGTFTNKSYKKFQLRDLEEYVLNASKNICTLPWKISKNILIDVCVYNLIAATTYPSKIKLEKEGNEILERRYALFQENAEDSQLDSPMESVVSNAIVPSNKILCYKMYSGKRISFHPSECKKIKHLCLEPSIEVLAFKPAMCDPMYHVNSAYFVTCTKFSDKGRKIFFKSFIRCCVSKQLMAICKVITNYTVIICQMVPSIIDNGFYMYKLPFDGYVRDLGDRLDSYKYNSENICPINKEAVDLFKQLMHASKVKFDLRKFTNPKLEKFIAHIEALALDEILPALPPDSTLPPPSSDCADDLKKKLSDLLNLVMDEPKRKHARLERDKRLELYIEDVARDKNLHTLTIPQLKNYLKSINKTTSGSKSILMERIYNYFKVS